MRRRVFFAFIVFLALSGVARGPGMVVGPARIELRLAAGETQETTISVTNPESTAHFFRLRAMPFTLTDTGDLKIESDAPEKPVSVNWIRINPEEVEIPANQTATIRLQLVAPAGHGTVWAGILCSIPPTGRSKTGFGVTTEPRVFVPIYITIKGTEQTGAEITNFQTVRDREGVFHFRASLHNTGNALLRPAGTWLLEENTPSGPVELLVVPFSGEPVLPGQVRKFEGEAHGKALSEKLTASVFFDYGQRRGEIVSQSGPVSSVDIAPKRETSSMASSKGAGPAVPSSAGSASKPVRISLTALGIRLEAGETIRYRSELKDSPPALFLDLVGYRVLGPRSRVGGRLVDVIKVDELQSKPVITRLEIHFKVPVEAKVVEKPSGLLIALALKTVGASLPKPLEASPPPTPMSPEGSSEKAPQASPPPTPAVSTQKAPQASLPRTPKVAPEASLPAPGNRADRYEVQVGTFLESANAQMLKTRLTASGLAVREESGNRDGHPFIILLVGPYPDRASAETARGELRELGVSDGVLRRSAIAP